MSHDCHLTHACNLSTLGDVRSSEIFPPNYQVYRKDRKCSGYGGVLLAIRRTLVSEQVSVEGDTESVFGRVVLPGNKSLVLGSIYRPTNDDKT